MDREAQKEGGGRSTISTNNYPLVWRLIIKRRVGYTGKKISDAAREKKTGGKKGSRKRKGS